MSVRTEERSNSFRLVAESDDSRSPFARDRDRIVHSRAFRRMQHKTQVFLSSSHDNERSRLTHSLEVAQIARSLSRMLAIDEDLTEAIALAHDLGHPPYGHSGEAALNEIAADIGGFNHNIQTLRIITSIEKRYLSCDGLNLTRASIEGTLKHGGPIPAEKIRPSHRKLAALYDFDPSGEASPEAACAAVADDVAYLAHDLDDGVRFGLVELDILNGIVPFEEIMHDARQRAAALDVDDDMRIWAEFIRRFVKMMISDLALGAEKSESVQRVQHSSEIFDASNLLRIRLHEQLYSHRSIRGPMEQGKVMIADLVELFRQRPGNLPIAWRRAAEERERALIDYVAGMTDRFLEEQWQLLCR